MAFARTISILCSFVSWFSRKFGSWMVLFGVLLDQFVNSFDRANGLSIFKFDAVWFVNFSAKDLDRWVQWNRMDLGQLFCLSFLKIQDQDFCWSWCFHCADFELWNALLDLSFLVCLMMVPTILLLFRDFFWRSGLLELRIRFVCLGSLVWLFSPAWDAVKLILPGCWLHLPFRGHWPYRFRSDDGSCSELAPGLMFDNFLPIPDAESLSFYPSDQGPSVSRIRKSKGEDAATDVVICFRWETRHGPSAPDNDWSDIRQVGSLILRWRRRSSSRRRRRRRKRCSRPRGWWWRHATGDCGETAAAQANTYDSCGEAVVAFAAAAAAGPGIAVEMPQQNRNMLSVPSSMYFVSSSNWNLQWSEYFRYNC